MDNRYDRYNGILKIKYFKRLRDLRFNIKKLCLTLKDYVSIPFGIDMNRSIIDIVEWLIKVREFEDK